MKHFLLTMINLWLSFPSMVIAHALRFLKWILTNHSIIPGWKVPHQKYLWCFSDYAMENSRSTISPLHKMLTEKLQCPIIYITYCKYAELSSMEANNDVD